ncbi:MarR family winged helix-turn-helix transcriptional regulator [Devosia sp.]|uniref:MarR family winged helix-turn-helix transcriptional regulator n=1 Tax=Devosia sp. TaxID=1871048 RepID=UPI002AFE9557|nr:MarR family transcriptional regulator [Devosia sp.]
MAQDEKTGLDDIIRELSAEISHVYRLAAEQAGLNLTDLMSLYFIKGEEGGATPKLLAAHLGLTSGATTILLNRLEARGFVRRQPHPTDRRGVLLALGPEANRQEFLNLRQRLLALNAGIIAELSAEEANVVRRFMSRMLANTRDSLRGFRLEQTGATPRDKSPS